AVPPDTVTGQILEGRPVNHLGQVTTAHRPGQRLQKAIWPLSTDAESKPRSRERRRVPRPPELSMPPFRQARLAGPSMRAGTMSTFTLGHVQVRRSGYGAMQLADPYAFGPPPDRASAIGVLRAAVAAGVDHIDTAQYYGPGMVNGLIRDAL